MRWHVTSRSVLALALLGIAAGVGLTDTFRSAQPVHHAEWVAAGDVLVRTVTLGSGDTTLVLLHGYGESLLAWRAIADPLARRYRVIALDLPGFGVSAKPAGGYDLASMTGRIASFIRAEARPPVVLVGHSMGGEIAAAVALAHPELVAGLVLVAPAGYGLSDAASQLPDPARALLGSATPLALGVHDPAWLAEPPARLRYDPVSDPAYRAATARVTRNFDFAGIGERFSELHLPVLLIWGRLDPTIPLALGQAIHHLIPGSCLSVLDHGLHRPHEAEPDTVLALTTKFLATGGSCAPDAPALHSPHAGD